MPKKTVKKHHKVEKPEEKKLERKFRKPPVGPEEPSRKPPEAAPLLAMLGRTAPVGKELRDMLAIPAGMHEENRWSFTSEEGKSVQALADAFMRKAPMPQDLPEYGINISSRGSNSFCTLIDRKRKIMVFESVGNMHVPEGGSWRSFQSALKDALDEAGKLGQSGTPFSFVICNEGILAHF